jgi:hypothetical protein
VCSQHVQKCPGKTQGTHIEDAIEFAEPVGHPLFAHSKVCKALGANGYVWEQLYDDASSWFTLYFDVQVHLQAAKWWLKLLQLVVQNSPHSGAAAPCIRAVTSQLRPASCNLPSVRLERSLLLPLLIPACWCCCCWLWWLRAHPLQRPQRRPQMHDRAV